MATRKKPPSRKKKTSSKKKVAAARSTSKKKTTTKKKAAASKSAKAATRKTSTKKKSTGKKTPARKTGAKKTPTKKVAASTSKQKKQAAAESAPAAKKTASAAKKTSKKSSKKTASSATAAAKSSRSKKKSLKGRTVAEVATASSADSNGYVFVNGRRVRMITTQTVAAIKKTRTAKADIVEESAAQETEKVVKTKLTKRDLEKYRNLLLIKRAEILGDLGSLEMEALRSGEGSSHMPIHMADIGSDAYDQDLMLGLAANERARIREIDDALTRIENGTYGVCVKTGKQIPKARLNAKPWAKYTIEAARELEGGWTG